MDTTLTVLALLTGLLTGVLFKLLGVPIPAPPKLPGVVGIVGIYLGYKVVTQLGYGVDLLSALGISG